MKPESTSTKKTIVRFHIWTVVGCFLFTLVFEKLTGRNFFSNYFVFIFLLMWVQVELFGWMGSRMFMRLNYSTVDEFKKKVLRQLFKFLVLVLLIGFALFVVTGVAISLWHGADPAIFIRNIPRYEMKGFLIGSGSGLLLGSLIYFVAELFRAISRLQKLQEEKLAYQYQTLKNQVNPHFLFNSLNTLSTLVHTNADVAEQFILRLSSTYRYILEHNENRLVLLTDELKFVREYFFLNQLRGTEKYRLKVDKEIPANLWVLPVSIQLLVENALKHNTATTTDPLVVQIRLIGDDYCEVSNNKQIMPSMETSTGTGLKNLNERIKQVCTKELIVEDTAERFTVKIPLIKSNESINYRR